MDYDDNDFQRQSFQLVGEENTKFSSGLCSYPLPKFDLDDNLQVGLRFDSLVESEVLLGIQSQEENQWIKDFSGGSTGIEFGSRAAESCSNLRRNNVWSEATSSESVEMLLKSVGQDEMITEQTIIEVSDVCDAPDNLTNQMEPNLNQDGSVPFAIGDTVDVCFTSPTEECLESFSVFNKDPTDQQLQIEATPQVHEGEQSGNVSLRDLDLSEAKQKENSPLCGKSEGNRTPDDSTASESMQVDPSVSFVQRFTVGAGDLNNQHVPLQTEGMPRDKAEKVGEHRVQSKEAQVDAQISEDKEGNPSASALRANFVVQMTEVSSEAVLSENSVPITKKDGAVFSRDTEMGDQLIGKLDETLSLVGEAGTSSEVLSVSGTVSMVVALVHLAEGHDKVNSSKERGASFENGGNQLDGGIYGSADTLTVEEKTDFNCQKNVGGINHAVDSSNLDVEMCLSTNIIHESQRTENLQDENDGVGVKNIEDLGAEAHISSSIQILDRNLIGTEPYDVPINHPNVSALEKENAMLTTDPGNVEIEMDGFSVLDKRTSSSALGPSIATTSVIVHESPSYQAVGKETVSTAVSNNKFNGIHHLLLGSGIAESEVIEHRVCEVSSSSGEDSPHLVKHEESETIISVEPSLLVVKESSQVVNKSIPYSDLEEGVGCDNAGVMVSEIVVQSSSSMGTVDVTSLNEPQRPLTDKAPQRLSKELEEHPVISDSSVAENDATEVCKKSKRLSVEVAVESLNGCQGSIGPAIVSAEDAEFHVLEDRSSDPNSSEPSRGSPTVIRGSEVSQSEKEHQEGDKGSLDQNASISDDRDCETNKARSNARDPEANDATEDERSFTFEVSSLSNPSKRESDNGWKPFPCIQPCEFAQTVGSSPSTSSSLCQISLKILQEVSRSPQTPVRNDVLQNSKGHAENKTKPMLGKVAHEGNAKEAKLLNNNLPQTEKELKKRCRGFMGQKTPVSDNIDGKGNNLRSIICDPKENDATVNRSFTFKGSSLENITERATDNRWKPFPSIQPGEFPLAVGMSPTTSGLCQIDAKALQEISHGCHQTSGGKNLRRSLKGNVEDRTRPSFGKVAGKETPKDRKTLKEITSTKQAKVRVSNSVSASPCSLGATSQVMQTEMRSFGHFEGSSTKPSDIPIVQTPNRLDLNTSASPSALFQRPFTDFQQVQLRSQILVYGSIIQGTAPDEAWMTSAFGESDGGRGRWENVWRAALDRIHSQKSPLSNTETPLHFHSGARVPESAARQSVHQSEALPTPVQAGSKGSLSSIINPVIPLSSPLWTISTPSRDGLQSSSMVRGAFMDPHQTLFSLHPFQSLHMRHYAGNAIPWLSQAPSPGTFVTPQTAAVDAGVHYPALPISEAVRVTSVRESSVPHPSGMQCIPLSPLVHTGNPSGVPVGTPLSMEVKSRTSSSRKDASADSKPRKRKKSLAPEELGQITSLVERQAEPESVAATAQLPRSVATTTTASVLSKVTSGSLVLPSSPKSSTHYQIITGRDTEQTVIFSEETCDRIEQAKKQAEDAVALASSTVKHSQGIWSQLVIQKNSGLVSDVEAKLASSAVAITAAASVAKAAAAAARVAFDAALQAKMMADEALVASKSGNPTPEASFHDGVINLGKVTLASILKGKDKINNSDSVLVAARVAARKRVEAASAAAKRAENLDAIVKAAEMAAEAVSQAGTIIAMGEPIPLALSELVEAGPEGYWKAQQTSSDQFIKSNNMNREQMSIDGVEEGLNLSVKNFNDRPSNKKEAIRTTERGKVPHPKEIPNQAVESHMWLINGITPGSVTGSEKGGALRKGSNMFDLSKTIGVVPESQIGSTNTSITVQNEVYEEHQPFGTSKENSIKEGSLVEVLFDEEGLRGVWFSGKVVSLKDGKAYICYTELVRDEGSGQRMEWVRLGGEGGKAPRIRIAHPMNVIKYERAKKRCRAARGDYSWLVGDKVDAWIRDGWWEGIITEKSKEDETNLTVHFPAQGDTSIIRAWNLRPSRIWEDGQWVEWSRSRENYCFSNEEKPLKKGRHGPNIDTAVEAWGKDKMSKHMGVEESEKTDASRPLTLSMKEKMFAVGQNIKDDKKFDALRTKRTGLLKEGSRVIFGVPKPGKKQKFMDVSKHYVADGGNKISEGNDSIKFAKFLIPQESASRGWKNTSKVAKGKQVSESKPKELKSGTTKSILTRNVSEKNGSSKSVSASNHGTVQDHFPNVKACVGHDANMSEKQSLQETNVSDTHKITEGLTSFSTLDLASVGPSSKKNSPAVAADFGSSVNVARSGEMLVGNDEKNAGNNDNRGRSMPEAVEPRRSNRRIQPTSRLLEGLQSSLIISKVPAVSHDKSTKVLASSGGRL